MLVVILSITINIIYKKISFNYFTMFNIIFYLVGILAMVWVIYDIFANNKKLDTGMKVLWVILAIVFSIITAIVYYIMYKR